MKKLFNKKTMVVYIVLMLVFAILSSVLIGVNSGYKKDFAKETEVTDLSDKVVNVISGLLTNLLGTNNSSDKENYSDAALAIKKKIDTTAAFAIVSFCLMLVMDALAIVAVWYPKYLKSDKYKAKIKRLEKAKKASNAKSK